MPFVYFVVTALPPNSPTVPPRKNPSLFGILSILLIDLRSCPVPPVLRLFANLADTRAGFGYGPDMGDHMAGRGLGVEICEHPVVGVAPAVLNAIQDAIGTDFYEIPVTPDKLLTALAAKAK